MLLVTFVGAWLTRDEINELRETAAELNIPVDKIGESPEVLNNKFQVNYALSTTNSNWLHEIIIIERIICDQTRDSGYRRGF